MDPGRKKFYITTSIAYTNNFPHIGHALEAVQADVLARFRRAKGDEVFFLTGADEHGIKVVRSASAAGKTPEKFTDEIAEKFRFLKEALNLSWDDFIRTTDKERHWPGVRLLWEKLAAAGDIYKKSYRGFYCVGHEAFVTKKDLVDGECPDHQTEPEPIEEENYFFRLSKYSEKIEAAIKSDELKILPESRKNEVLSFIKNEGLEDVSFSRPRKDLTWGVPVPGDEAQTMYVWCDALTNYISAMGYGQPGNKRQGASDKGFEYWWPADVQLIGKDIIRFHAAIWPGMLLSAGLPLPKQLFVHGFVTVDGKKMSKTIGNIVDPFELVEKYGTDAVRYYLLREIPSDGDGDWGEGKFRERYNADLANGLGNFAARVLTLGSAVKEFPAGLEPDREITKHIDDAKKEVSARTEEFKLHEALQAIWELVSYGDAYVSKTTPWDIEYEEKKAHTVFNLVVILDNVAALLWPFLPQTAEKITKCIVWDGELRVTKPETLFPRLR